MNKNMIIELICCVVVITVFIINLFVNVRGYLDLTFGLTFMVMAYNFKKQQNKNKTAIVFAVIGVMEIVSSVVEFING